MMRTALLAASSSVVLIVTAACSSGGGSGGGGMTLSDGNYVSSNAQWAPDACNIQAQQPAGSLDGKIEAVVVTDTTVTVGTEVFTGSGTSFTAAAIGTNTDLTGSGIDCVLHQAEQDSLAITGHDKFRATLALTLSEVSGADCGLVAATLGTAFPCSSTATYDSTKQ